MICAISILASPACHGDEPQLSDCKFYHPWGAHPCVDDRAAAAVRCIPHHYTPLPQQPQYEYSLTSTVIGCV